jgi:hypothetical protein
VGDLRFRFLADCEPENPAAHTVAKPIEPDRVVYAYYDLKTPCKYCMQLARAADADKARMANGEPSQLQCRFEFHQAPANVNSFPLLVWRDSAGNVQRHSGWPGVDRFRGIVEERDAAARRTLATHNR